LRPFLFITILSALVIAGTAALFSVTGISSIFAGHFIQVAIMAGALEVGKVVISSILYRYWTIMNTPMKSYMIVALLVLMIITSAGIYGYLSEAYQKTKSKYDITDKEVVLLMNKKQLFQNEYDRYEKRLNDLVGIRTGQETRLDSLYSRGQTTSARRVEDNIKRQDIEIQNLNKQILAVSDSISKIETTIIGKQSDIIKGDLGPLQYIAITFNTDMDTVVKFFILILIFVFDPLAVTLIVAANMIYVNKHYAREEWTDLFKNKKQEKEEDEYLASDEAQGVINRIKKTINDRKLEKQVEKFANEYLEKEEANTIFPDNENIVEEFPTKPEEPEEPYLSDEDREQLRRFDEWRNSDNLQFSEEIDNSETFNKVVEDEPTKETIENTSEKIDTSEVKADTNTNNISDENKIDDDKKIKTESPKWKSANWVD